MPTEGYLLVMQPHRMVELYERTRLPETLALWRRVTEAGGLDPARYRGMSRLPLTPLPSLDMELNEAFALAGLDMEADSFARRRFRELVPDDDAVLESVDQRTYAGDRAADPCSSRSSRRLGDRPDLEEQARGPRRPSASTSAGGKMTSTRLFATAPSSRPGTGRTRLMACWASGCLN